MSLAQGLGLIFDLDGVIVDSMPLHLEAWKRYLARHGFEREDLERRTHGHRNDYIVRDLFGADLTAEEIVRHGADKEALFRELMRPLLESKLVPGIAAFLERHRETPMAVASNAEPPNIDFTLDGTGLRSYFKAIVDCTQVLHAKPYPDVYLKAFKELDILPENCVVFEDSPAGVLAARAAGARVVGVETHDSLDEVDFKIADFRAPELDRWLMARRPE
jgi:beta-phosphoglucomutase